jgi:hypothetical protein
MKKTTIALVVIICIAMIAISAVVLINLFIDSQASQLTARLNTADLPTSLLDANADIIFSPLGCRRYSIGDEWIRLFVYSDSASAQADASRLGPSGSPYIGVWGFTAISWAKDPHFYIEDNIIIFYGGSNSTLLSGFENLFGPQFAGYSSHSN